MEIESLNLSQMTRGKSPVTVDGHWELTPRGPLSPMPHSLILLHAFIW